MKNNSEQNIFLALSKLTIIIPLVLIIIALFIRFNQGRLIKNLTFPIMSPTITPKASEDFRSRGKINLMGPLVCRYTSNSASVSAYIKNKHIYMTMEKKDSQENYLLLDDCLYWWEKNKFSGQKICGLTPYLSLIETILNLNLLSFDQLPKFLSQSPLTDITATQEADIINLVDTCQKGEINDRFYILPKQIIFKNINFLTPSPT